MLAEGEQHHRGCAACGGGEDEGAGAGAAADSSGGEGVRGGGPAAGEAADRAGGAGIRKREENPAAGGGGAGESSGVEGSRHQENQLRHARDHVPFLQAQIPAGRGVELELELYLDRVEFHLGCA